VTSHEIDPLRECLVYIGTATRTVGARRHPWLSDRGQAAMTARDP